MMIRWRMVAIGLMLVFQGRDAVVNDAKECIIDCRRKVEDVDICYQTCLKLLQEHTINDFPETQEPLLTPGVPALVSSEFRSIRLSWNVSIKSKKSAVRYIVEIYPKWKHQVEDVIFPYLEKYRNTSETVYTVEKLLAKTSFKFRVTAVTLNETSYFSNWSNLISTNYTCPKKRCSVTNVRLKLTLLKAEKRMTGLNGTIFWEPTTGLETYGPNFQSSVIVNLLTQEGYCQAKFKHEYNINGKKEELTNKSLSFREIVPADPKQETAFHFGCSYKIIIGLKHVFGEKALTRTWNMHIPRCYSGVCGCKYIDSDVGGTFVNINLTRTSKNASAVTVTWKNEKWWDDVNVTHYVVMMSFMVGNFLFRKTAADVESKKHIYNYNASFSNLKDGQVYTIQLTAYYGDHCRHRIVTALVFNVSYPCLNNPCPPNTTCSRDGWMGKIHCDCVPGFVKIKGTCQESNPCHNNSCPENFTCHIKKRTGAFECTCSEGFKKENDTCVAIYYCEVNPNSIGCLTTKVPKNDNIGTIVASVVPPLLFIITIAFLIFFYKRRYKKMRLGNLARVMESVAFSNNSGITTLTNPYDFQHPMRVALEPDKDCFEDDRRELNVLYVPQEITEAIAMGLTDGLFELSSERLELGKVIGKGAFGEVYVGDAHGILDNPEWTKVAVKKLADSANDSEVHDFLDEIKLMKTLGRHENVIQMYGCCTLTPPICLIMEFASGGNLLDYLRSLKRKCEETASLTNDPGTQDMSESKKNKFEKFFEPGEMPDQSTTYSFPGTEPSSNDCISNDNVKNIEVENEEIATKVNQEIQTALNPKELESFARQIVNGMTHVADLGIVHRDLAARNILLDENNVLKISDFGLSREGIYYVKKTGGKIPLRWLSLEAIHERRYSTASDVWAFGIVLWEICTLGHIPYPSVYDNDLLDFLVSGKRMKKAASCSDEIHEIMLRCWSHRPEDRPTFTELSKFLWQLEHKGNSYVNIEPLITSSSFPANEADDGSTGDIEQENDPNALCGPKSSHGIENPPESPHGIDNPAFWNSVEDLNCDDQQHILPRKQKSQLQNGDAKISTQHVANGISNHGADAENTGDGTSEIEQH